MIFINIIRDGLKDWKTQNWTLQPLVTEEYIEQANVLKNSKKQIKAIKNMF